MKMKMRIWEKIIIKFIQLILIIKISMKSLPLSDDFSGENLGPVHHPPDLTMLKTEDKLND